MLTPQGHEEAMIIQPEALAATPKAKGLLLLGGLLRPAAPQSLGERLGPRRGLLWNQALCAAAWDRLQIA
jgi:hypothetical protein